MAKGHFIQYRRDDPAQSKHIKSIYQLDETFPQKQARQKYLSLTVALFLGWRFVVWKVLDCHKGHLAF